MSVSAVRTPDGWGDESDREADSGVGCGDCGGWGLKGTSWERECGRGGQPASKGCVRSYHKVPLEDVAVHGPAANSRQEVQTSISRISLRMQPTAGSSVLNFVDMVAYRRVRT
jgi:hypothetical protein